MIGGDAGGMTAASQAKRLAGDALDVVVVERGEYTSYAACGLPYVVAGEVDSVEDLVVRSPEAHRERGILVHTRTEVTSIDTDAGTVTVAEVDSGAQRTESYDDLVIATGAVPVRPPLPGIDARGVFDLRTIPDATALDESVRGASRAVIVGGGYIGLEVAEAFIARGLGVTLLEASDQPAGTLDPDMAELVAAELRRLGVDLRLGTSADEFEVDDTGRLRGVRVGEDLIPADVAVLGVGVRPNVELAEAAGVPLGPSGAIAVDRRMRTRVEGVWAAGDCVESFHRVSRQAVNIALGTHANKQGRVVGTNIGGGYATFEGVLGTAIMRVGDAEIARTGLNEREAAAAGFEIITASTTTPARAHYFPGAEPAVVKLVAERGSGRLLGGQIVGGANSGKRIDTIATALWNGMTVAELAGVDLAYAPPFSPVWDPVLLAAGRTAAAVEAGESDRR